MELTIAVYQRRVSGDLEWTTLGLAPHDVVRRSLSPVKLEQAIVEAVRTALERVAPLDLARFEMTRGTNLVRARLELTLGVGGARRRVSSMFPIVVEPRRTAGGHVSFVGYHPAQQDAWWCFEKEQESDLPRIASAKLSTAWAAMDPEEVATLTTDGKDGLRAIRFSIRPRSLLDELPDGPAGVWDDLRAGPFGAQRGERPPPPDVLRHVGTDLTLRALDGAVPLGMPRTELRERLAQLLGAKRAREPRRSILLVGPPSAGKTSLVHRWVADALEADDYPTHRNLDRVRHVWSIAGARLIAGMSHLGQWEQRCLELVTESATKNAILYVEDLPAFGRIGRARDSDRSLAEVLRGPVGRGEIVLIGECTPESLSRLEDEAPSFAALFTRLHVPEATEAETLRMLLHERRVLEAEHDVAIDAVTLRGVLDLGSALFPGTALPGKALDLLRQLVRHPAQLVLPGTVGSLPAGAISPSAAANDGGSRKAPRYVGASDVVDLLVRRTGIPRSLLAPRGAQDPSVLATGLERRVIGQPRATEAAVDVLLRVRAGLVDPGRPHAVYLLTGPTGTGKTELARAIAEALYSDEQRLLRFDMAEHGTPDAVARLIGDSWRPDGVLTRAVREQPFAVVLLDEIDKAHPSVLNLLLQLLDDGRLGNAAGEMADFRHTVVVMTSNLGASAMAPVGFLPPTGGATTEAIRAVAEHLSPELFNRIDRVVAFEPLSPGTARRVAAKELGSLIRRRGLSDRRVFATATTGLLDLAVEQGFDSRGGARTVKRWLEDHVATPLAEHVAARPAAPLAWVRLHRRTSEVGLRYDALVEQSAPSAPSSLEDVVDLPLGDLRSVAGGAQAALDRLAASEPFAAMKERSSELLARAQAGDRDAATALHSLDELRETLRTVRGVLSNRRAGHDELIRAVALARFLPHVTGAVENPASHSVRLELSRMGAASRPRMGVGRAPDGMLEWLARAYASHGKLVAFATSPRRDFPLAMTGHDVAALESAFLAGIEDAVLDIEGLGISLLLAGEHGSHLWESVAGGAEVVRVLVSPLEGASSPPAAVIEAHHARLGAFERALEGGARPLPEDPGALLPAVRRLRFDLPRFGSGTPYDVALEDYGLAHVASLRVASPIPVIERALLLRMGRVG